MFQFDKLASNVSVSFSMHHWNSFKHLSRLSQHMPVRPYERIDCYSCGIGCRWNMVARSFLINNILSTISKPLSPNIYCWSRKYLSTYAGCISEWIRFALSPFAYTNRLRELCSLWDVLSVNTAYCLRGCYSDNVSEQIIFFFLVLFLIFLFLVPCGRLNWLSVSFSVHVKKFLYHVIL